MKVSLSNSLKILAGTVISAVAGLAVLGPRIFDVHSQYFHFILAGFLISLMWIPAGRLVKGGVILGFFLIYKGLIAPPFASFFLRDAVYFLMFFLLSFFPPVLLQRWKVNRPVGRFVFGGLVVATGYFLSALAIILLYRSYAWDNSSLMKVNLLYGLTIGLAVELGFELINLLFSVIHGRTAD